MTKVEGLLRQLHQRYNTVETYADLCALLEAGRAEGAEQMKDDVERWILSPENEDVSRTYVTSTYCQKDINVERVVDFLHDRIQLPVSVLAPKEEP